MSKPDLDPVPKSRPIIFGAHGVNAILDHRKSQTRRVIKLDYSIDWELVYFKDELAGFHNAREYLDDVFKCPFGKIGDLLWVRETFWDRGCFQATGELTKTGRPELEFISNNCGYVYHANEQPMICHQAKSLGQMGWHKRPSIFMLRRASRINLEITDIRVERLHEMSERDAEAEGVGQWCDGGYDIANGYRISFCALWDSINGKTNPWKNNDWVWALTFKQIQS